MLISVVVTVKNEAEHMPQLLDSLLVQGKPFEIIVVDADSTDETPNIVKNYAKKHDEIRYISYDQTRGESRNFGVKKAKGDAIAFTDGSCMADPNWLKLIRAPFLVTQLILDRRWTGKVHIAPPNCESGHPTTT